MKMKKLRIATRNSPLAMCQAEHIKKELLSRHTDLEIELLGMTTKGDTLKDTKLLEAGGKGLFIKELEQALLENKADIAVHSMKDVTVDEPEGLIIPVICEREDPRDVFVSNNYLSFEELPQFANVGTSSLRRQCQLRAERPDLYYGDLRGNVNTRLQKLDDGEFEALILAAAGLKRLSFNDRIRQFIDIELSLPAVGQGALGIECRKDDKEIIALITPLNHLETYRCVMAERAANRELKGGCRLPIAVHATIEGKTLFMDGLVGKVDGTRLIECQQIGSVDDYEELGKMLADDLLKQGAKEILDDLKA